MLINNVFNLTFPNKYVLGQWEFRVVGKFNAVPVLNVSTALVSSYFQSNAPDLGPSTKIGPDFRSAHTNKRSMSQHGGFSTLVSRTFVMRVDDPEEAEGRTKSLRSSAGTPRS